MQEMPLCSKGYLTNAAIGLESLIFSSQFTWQIVATSAAIESAATNGKVNASDVTPNIDNSHPRELIMSTAIDFAHNSSKDRVFGIVRDILERRSPGRSIRTDEDLRDAGLNSLDMVNLMLAVEAEFDLKIPDADMTLRNFQSISAIDALVSSLLPGG
jgi:acyl carrier protein